MFTGADFEGFQKLGEGSKSHDPKAIGQFGRGSQTMYHWTDVPMILSADRLIILILKLSRTSVRTSLHHSMGCGNTLKISTTTLEPFFASRFE